MFTVHTKNEICSGRSECCREGSTAKSLKPWPCLTIKTIKTLFKAETRMSLTKGKPKLIVWTDNFVSCAFAHCSFSWYFLGSLPKDLTRETQSQQGKKMPFTSAPTHIWECPFPQPQSSVFTNSLNIFQFVHWMFYWSYSSFLCY